MLLLALLLQDTFYVDAVTGNDAAAGTSPAAAWKSVAAVQAAQARLKPGDRVLFRRGQRFPGPLKLTRSGEDAKPVTYAAFGEGAAPELTGFATPGGWTRVAPGVWEGRLPSGTVNALVVDGLPRALGRWPNEGWLTIDRRPDRTSIEDAELPAAPDWRGAELVLRKVRWVIDRSRVTRHEGSRLTYVPTSTYDAVDGHGYFLQNHPAALDAFGEWCVDPAARTLRVVLDDPARHDVRAAVVDVLVSARDRRNLVFEGLRFSGANVAAL
ncbi:MAG TPA: hypothetical protein VEJ18_21735, partial [Planctomycetota bacterium]|nr:hypothetical protein [Planctomycetota bacterium]